MQNNVKDIIPFFVVHILQPVSEIEYGGADMHVFELAIEQKKRGKIIPIVVIRKNMRLRERFIENDIICYCGSLYPNMIKFIFYIHKKLKKYPVKILHSHGYDANFYMVLLKFLFPKKWKYIPTIITCHGWIETSLILKLKTMLDFLCHKYSQAIIVCSEINLKRLKKNRKQTHIHISNGISFDRYKNSNLNNVEVDKIPKIIAYVGRISCEKRIDIFIKVANFLLRKRRNLLFKVIGSGPEKYRLHQKAKSLHIDNKLIFSGQIENIEKAYQEIDILILPSDTESSPRVLMEAMYNQVPVIATDVGDVKDIVIHDYNGYIVPIGKWKKITYYVEKLLNNNNKRIAMGINGKTHIIRYYSIQSMEIKVMKTYMKVCQNGF